MSVFIIGEAGVNHNGSLAMAKELVDIAVEAGVDAVKFQTFTAASLVTLDAKACEYQTIADPKLKGQFDLLKSLELSRPDHLELIAHCKRQGIEFMSSAFDLASIEFLEELKVKTHKVPSGEITNYPYLAKLGRTGKPIILSTGMSTLGEIEAAIAVIVENGGQRNRISILHCNSAYPTPMPDVNLRAMDAIRVAFQLPVGFSDHTPGIEVPIAAVAMGAVVIEKHFTADKSLPGPDHKASLNGAELKEMVRSIRNVEKALGSGLKTPSASELKNKALVRKSIVAARTIDQGEIFTADNLATKRVGRGLGAQLWDQVIGRAASRTYVKDEAIDI